MGREKQQRKNTKVDQDRYLMALNNLQTKISATMAQIRDNRIHIDSQLTRLCSRLNKKPMMTHHFTELWAKWLEYDVIKYEQDTFAGFEPLKFKDPNDLWKAPSLEIFWKAINFYWKCNELKWQIRFTQKARKKVLLWAYNIRENFIEKMVEYAIGYIVPGKNCEIIEEGPCANMVYFSTGVRGTDNTVIFAMLMDSIPIIKNKKLVQYRFNHYLKVIDIVKKNKFLRGAVDTFKNSIKNDPDRWIEPITDSNGQFIFPSFQNSVVTVSPFYVYPKMLPRVYLTSRESDSIIFDNDHSRWVPLSVLKKIEANAEIDPYQLSIINKLGSATSTAEFINFLKKIPDFRIKLTEEQEKLVGSPGNVLAIGRSGTGKTTCSILRLLSTEILFRYTLRDKSRRFTPEDYDRSTLLHTVFVTASPVLTNEVKRFYTKLGDHIKAKLKLRDEKLKLKEINAEMVDLDIEENPEIDDADSENEEMGPVSMEFLTDEDFPLFVTVRKVIFMVDAAVKRPFFARDRQGNVIGSSSKFQWHNEYKGALMINKQFKIQRQTADVGKIEIESSDSDEEIEDFTESAHSKAESKKKAISSHNHYKKNFRHLSFEVDFSVFAEKFFPRIQHKCKYSALLLWTEISAYIKGSANSYKYGGFYLSRSAYMGMGRKASMLTAEEKYEIWDLFIEYERWKVRLDAYDMQDVVNYLLGQLSFYGYNGVPIHYMMIDEVQDLTPATITLLLMVTKQKLFFSGDTAQTIAKGVGFRFCDLKSLFSESKLELPSISQLTMNFRTHNQILGLANSVVALLETLFPLTIDKMAKEISPVNGPMPALVTSTQIEHLLHIVFGSMIANDNEKQPEFGCNQVIIVRNQKSKETLPSMLKHALCLTVFESKGLEFDDVILYNFFTETEADPSQWAVLRNIQKRKDYDFYTRPENFEQLETSLPKLSAEVDSNNAALSMLCTELKHLYVAITRPKKRLIIFDEATDARKPIEMYWKYMNVVDYVNVEVLSDGSLATNAFTGGFAKKTEKSEWKSQGLRMFSRKYYEQAEKCFGLAEEKHLELRARGYSLANKAGEVLSSIESALDTAKWEKKVLTRTEKKNIKVKKAFALDLFRQAAFTFLEILNSGLEQDVEKVKKEAARCFSSANEHAKAAELFKELGLYGQAAEAEAANSNFEAAGDLFVLKEEYIRAFEVFKLGRCWEKLIKTIFLFKDRMNVDERQKYIQKFMPPALEDLTPKLNVNTDTQYISQVVKENQAIIEESEEESEDYEEKIQEKNEIGEKNEEILKNPEKVEENKEIIADNPEEIMSEPHYTEEIKVCAKEGIKEPEMKDDVSNTSFSLLSSQTSFGLLSENLDDVDPDDEWLQIETGSIIESLSSVIQPDGSILSDYSILESNQNPLVTYGKLIRTRGDIYIEDLTMRKIIEYISMFSEEVSQYLVSLRSAKSLISSTVLSQDWELASLIDLEEISPQILGLILDTLEEYGMYKLCLIVCNRYNLVNRAGRYIVSLAFKYSNISMANYAAFKLNPKEQIQRAAIAYTALHNVLEMINPCYLNIGNSDLGLGIENYQRLVMLGYWKKVIFLLDSHNSKALAWTFGDFKTYKMIFAGNSPKNIENHPDEVKSEIFENFEWLAPWTLENITNLNDFVVGLDSVTLYLLKDTNTKIPEFPEFFNFSRSVLQSLKQSLAISEEIKASLPIFHTFFTSNQELDTISTLKIYDLCNFYSILFQHMKKPNILNSLLSLSSSEFESFLIICNYILKYLKNGSFHFKILPLLRHCLLSSWGIRSIYASSLTKTYPIYTHSILLCQSPILQSLSRLNLPSADLECTSFIGPNLEIHKSFIDSTLSHLNYIVEARSRSTSTMNGRINALGEIWYLEFITSERPYSLKNYDYMTKISPDLYQHYLEVQRKLNTILADDSSDVYYAEYIRDKNKKKIKKLSKVLNDLEKQMANAQPGERAKVINQIVHETRYSDLRGVELTKNTKQALLTHAQVLMNSDEVEVKEIQFSNIWMAFELCRIGGHGLCFIEMLRARNKPMIVSHLKRPRASILFHYAVMLADVHAYELRGCFTNVTETILEILSLVEVNDDLKTFLIEKAVFSWVVSYKSQVKMPESFSSFLWLPSQPIVKDTGKIKYQVLEYCCNSLTEFCVKSINDSEKTILIRKICDCLALVIGNIVIDDKVLEILKKQKFRTGVGLSKGFDPYHVFFQLIEEVPNIKTENQGEVVEVSHLNDYPQNELDKDWVEEVKKIAVHQNCANFMRKAKRIFIKSERTQQPNPLDIEYSMINHKKLSENTSKLMQNYQKYLHELFNTFYKTVLFKSLDMHYLLDQIYLLNNEIEHVSEENHEEKIAETNNAIQRFANWKIMVQPNPSNPKEKIKRKWNVNWKKQVKDLKKRKN